MALYMAEPEKTTIVQSTLGKGIAYDNESGRFFETDGECIPDEEYCVLDKDSGEMIRLTLEEKERIFMDALQVRILRLFWQRVHVLRCILYGVPHCFSIGSHTTLLVVNSLRTTSLTC